jgi:hypothetical protein
LFTAEPERRWGRMPPAPVRVAQRAGGLMRALCVVAEGLAGQAVGVLGLAEVGRVMRQ